MAKTKQFSLVSSGGMLAENSTKKSVQQYKKSSVPKVVQKTKASGRGR